MCQYYFVIIRANDTHIQHTTYNMYLHVWGAIFDHAHSPSPDVVWWASCVMILFINMMNSADFLWVKHVWLFCILIEIRNSELTRNRCCVKMLLRIISGSSKKTCCFCHEILIGWHTCEVICRMAHHQKSPPTWTDLPRPPVSILSRQPYNNTRIRNAGTSRWRRKTHNKNKKRRLKSEAHQAPNV